MAEGIGLYRRDRRNLRLYACGEVQQCFRCLLRQVIGQVEERVLGGCPHIAQPFGRNPIAQQLIVRDTAKQKRLGYCRHRDLDRLMNDDLFDSFADFDKLRGARSRMPLNFAPLGPSIRTVMMIDVTEQKARLRPVDDQADIGVDAHGPEILVPRLVQPMELHPRRGRIELQVKGRRLDGLLLVPRQSTEAVGKGVCDPEFHWLMAALGWSLSQHHTQ
jgi:hypothetical protein